MNKPMIKIVQFGCIVVSVIIFSLITFMVNDYVSYSSYRKHEVSFEDYYYAFKEKDYMRMAQYSYQDFKENKDIDANEFISFSSYYALLQTYLACDDITLQKNCLQQMQQFAQEISFNELINEINRLNTLYCIEF